MPANKLKDIINTQDIGSDCIEKMSFNRKYEIIAACSNNGYALFYKLDNPTGKLTLLARIQADFSPSPFIVTSVNICIKPMSLSLYLPNRTISV